MLKKNKDYVEFTLQYTSVDWARRSKDCPEVCLKGYSDFSFPGVPIMDVVCNELDHKVVVVSKRDFDRLQADDQHYRELAKQREENYKALLDKTGFYNLADLMCYLPKDKTLKDIIDGLAAENEGLIKKLQESDPFAEKKELLEKLYSKEDVEKLEWTLNHICGGRASVNGWMVTARLWKRCYEDLFKLIGFSSVEEIQDYLTNEAECDTLHEAISKLHDQVKYTCDEWGSANSNNNSWKAAAECNSPKELIEKLNLLRDDIFGRCTVIESYKRSIEKWQEATGCNTPEEAKSRIEGLENAVRLTDTTLLGELEREIDTWQKATGCNEPKDFLKWKANIEGILEAWKSGTGCKYPAEARILLEKWKVLTKCETPEAAATWIVSYEKACERGNKLAEDAEKREKEWQDATGYSCPEDFLSGNELAESAAEREKAHWQDATGRISPEAAKQYIDRLKGRLNKIHGYSVDF